MMGKMVEMNTAHVDITIRNKDTGENVDIPCTYESILDLCKKCGRIKVAWMIPDSDRTQLVLEVRCDDIYVDFYANARAIFECLMAKLASEDKK